MSKSFSSSKSNKKKPAITFLAAAEFEFTFLREKILKSKNLRKEFHFKFIPIGVGPIAAAKSLAKLKVACQNTHVVLIGTCGEIGASKNLFKLLKINIAKWEPWDIRNKKAYLVGDFFPHFELKKSWAIFQNLDCASLCGSSSITKTQEENFKAPSKQTFVENLEVYSLLPEIDLWSKTFTPLLMVTNQTGKSAHAEWKKNYLKAAKLSSDQIYQILEKNIK